MTCGTISNFLLFFWCLSCTSARLSSPSVYAGIQLHIIPFLPSLSSHKHLNPSLLSPPWDFIQKASLSRDNPYLQQTSHITISDDIIQITGLFVAPVSYKTIFKSMNELKLIQVLTIICRKRSCFPFLWKL